MRNNFGAGNIEAINPKRLTEVELLKMYEIERDTWSYFMGEYVKCKNCDEVFSKEDIYGEIDDNYKERTVIELEKRYGRKNIKCKCCDGETEDVRGEELIKSLELRIFGTKESFINFYRGKVDEILGFSYGFIDSPENVYEKEFHFHFTNKLLEKFIERFGTENLLALSGVCFKERDITIDSIYELIKHFFYSIRKYKEYTVVGEAIKGSPSYRFYIGGGGKEILLKENMFKKPDLLGKSTVVYVNNITELVSNTKDLSLKDFIKFVKKRIGNI